MASSVAPKAYPINFQCLVEIYNLHKTTFGLIKMCIPEKKTFKHDEQNSAFSLKKKNR